MLWYESRLRSTIDDRPLVTGLQQLAGVWIAIAANQR
jgi:hypothetical protein